MNSKNTLSPSSITFFSLSRFFLRELFFSVVALFFVSLFWSRPLLLLVLLLLLSGIVLLERKEKSELFLFIFASMSGSIAEIIAIYFGAWTYALPLFAGIPLWLIPLWGLAALFIKRIMKLFY